MNICVFGASSNNIDKEYLDEGRKLGRIMACKGHTLVFGGGATGLMGAVARGVAEKNGEIIGIAPSFFDEPGVLYEKCTEFYFTETMRERKELMENKSEAFIMTPGGIGTMEEFFEILTLRQLMRHEKPIGILNTKDYYDELIHMLVRTAEQGFMDLKCMDMISISKSPDELLESMK